jgi:hypothetical protein
LSQIYKSVTASGTTVVQTLTGNDGIKVGPSGGNINVIGNDPNPDGYGTYVSNSAPNTELVSSHGLAKWVVNPVMGLGTHQTISAAIASASAGDDIFVTAGTYVESPTLKAGVNIIAFVSDAETPTVIIQGTVTASYTGTATISGIEIQANGGYAIVNSGANATVLNLNLSNILAVNNTAINFTNSNSSAVIDLDNCFGNLQTTGITYFTMTSPGTISMTNCRFSNSGLSSTQSTSSAGVVNISYSGVSCPISLSGTSAGTFYNISIQLAGENATPITLSQSGSFATYNSRIFSGTAVGLMNNATGLVKLISNEFISNSSTTYAISGSGTVTLGFNNFTGSATLINPTLTISPIFSVMGTLQMTGGLIKNYRATAISTNVLITDCIIGITSDAAARTMTMPNAGMIAGQEWTFKDEAGAASSHNITISGNGVNIDGAANLVITTNYGSVTIYWNGSQFFSI